MHIVNHLSDYERLPSPLQPRVLMGVEPIKIGKMLRESKRPRSADEQQLINAWRGWKDQVLMTEWENESRIRILFRALTILSRELDTANDEKKEKVSDIIGLINAFLNDIWGIQEAMVTIQDGGTGHNIAKRVSAVREMTNDWRDPIGARQG